MLTLPYGKSFLKFCVTDRSNRCCVAKVSGNPFSRGAWAQWILTSCHFFTTGMIGFFPGWSFTECSTWIDT